MKITKGGRFKLPKFKNGFLASTDYLNYFKPIKVPSRFNNQNGVYNETIIVNPLTGVVEVTGRIIFDSLLERERYTENVRKWKMNSLYMTFMKKHYDIDGSEYLISFKDKPAVFNYAPVQEEFDYVLGSVIDPSHIAKVLTLDIELDLGSFQHSIDFPPRLSDVRRSKTPLDIEPTGGNDWWIANSRDAYVHPPVTGNNLDARKAKLFISDDGKIKVNPPRLSKDNDSGISSDKLVVYKFKYSFEIDPNTFNDIVDFYEYYQDENNYQSLGYDNIPYVELNNKWYIDTLSSNYIKLFDNQDNEIKSIQNKSINTSKLVWRDDKEYDTANFMLEGGSNYNELYRYLRDSHIAGNLEFSPSDLSKWELQTIHQNTDITPKVTFTVDNLPPNWWKVKLDAPENIVYKRTFGAELNRLVWVPYITPLAKYWNEEYKVNRSQTWLEWSEDNVLELFRNKDMINAMIDHYDELADGVTPYSFVLETQVTEPEDYETKPGYLDNVEPAVALPSFSILKYAKRNRSTTIDMVNFRFNEYFWQHYLMFLTEGYSVMYIKLKGKIYGPFNNNFSHTTDRIEQLYTGLSFGSNVALKIAQSLDCGFAGRLILESVENDIDVSNLYAKVKAIPQFKDFQITGTNKMNIASMTNYDRDKCSLFNMFPWYTSDINRPFTEQRASPSAAFDVILQYLKDEVGFQRTDVAEVFYFARQTHNGNNWDRFYWFEGTLEKLAYPVDAARYEI